MRSFRRFKVNAKKCLDKNGQLILAITAGVSAVTGAVLSFKAGEHAVEINETRQEKIDDATERLQNGDISNDDFKKECKDANVEATKEYVKYCGPAVMSIGVTLVSITCGYRISIGKQAAALAALKIAESKKDELEAKTKELLGEKKLDEIKKGILSDHVNSQEVPNDVHAPEYEKDENGNFIAKQYMLPFMLDYDGSFFMGTRVMVDRAISQFAAKIKREMSGDLNELKACLKDEGCVGSGLEAHPNGDGNGWLPDDLDHQAILEYDIQPIMHDALETPVQVIEFVKDPALFSIE